MNGLVVLFFCIGLLMVFASVVLFVLIGVKYKESSKLPGNIENEKMELEAILQDARELLRHLDQYSSDILESMDKRVDEFKALLNESNSRSNRYGLLEKEGDTDEVADNQNEDGLVQTSRTIPDLDEIKNSLHKTIMKQYYSGASEEEISRNLNMGKGEVKLIIKRYHK